MKKFLAVFVALVMLALTACADVENDKAEVSSTAPEPQKVITEINPYIIKADTAAFMTDSDVTFFRKALDAIFERQDTVVLSDDYDANLRVMLALKYNPYWFFVEESDLNNDHTTLYFKYKYSADEQAQMRQFMDEQYLSILNSIITPEMNHLDMLLAVYKYFGQTISYDYDWLYGLNMSDDKFLYPDIVIYEALKTGKGVCHTYAYLCEFALSQLGIECLRLNGSMQDDEETGHMWFVAKLNDRFYHFDPTWDSDDGSDNVGLKYFGMTDWYRADSGINLETVSYDSAYGEIICDSDIFEQLHNVYNYEYAGNNQWKLYCDEQTEPTIYNTQDVM